MQAAPSPSSALTFIKLLAFFGVFGWIMLKGIYDTLKGTSRRNDDGGSPAGDTGDGWSNQGGHHAGHSGHGDGGHGGDAGGDGGGDGGGGDGGGGD